MKSMCLVHHNAATRNAAMHNAIFFTSQFTPLFCSFIAVMPFPVFSIARDNFSHRAHRLSAFASKFPFATMVYCTKQQEIYQESQRSDVAGWPSQTQTQTQRCGALSPCGSACCELVCGSPCGSTMSVANFAMAC